MGEGVKGEGDARRERWREHRAARRAEFVEAALKALDEHGPDLAMEHVAAAAGVTKPVLYRHFTDKADLFVALGQRGTEILFERLIPAINREEAPVPRIRRSLDAFFSVIEDHPNLYRMLARKAFNGRPVDSDPVREDKEMIAAALTSLLGDYMRALGLDSGAAEPWAYSIVGMVQTTGEWWLDRRSMTRDALVEYLTTIIWSAIDGFLRQHGIEIAPDKPIEINKVVQLRRAR
ncbi:TetR/AcrR family transcriptional regulator [Kibdelosporangium phytohabitans]|uniref:TetR family transcriptional regulator n=1 Tax=Kibdelosporangium phytohabitans TaxID=860235 RepID=A0A0N9HPY3_9PSEU|nr:TetR/AcrR family transcriptional regulator [Kibdelosporangium phytohabitans]ALG06721.1 TetR family transcriptional regulator [Kibdelosporangium phytohabitans]MBE1467944.1 AcrR family transcriptional regulator [Kibdelosporangium phytohabitans]